MKYLIRRMHDETFHIPVLLNEAIDLLINQEIKGQTIVDGTSGGGGYAGLICKKLKSDFKLICIDKDLNALKHSEQKLKPYEKNTIFVNDDFGNLKNILNSLKISHISGLVLDLGLSTYQLNFEDGFSFMRDSFLDMRANKKETLKADDVINGYSREELENIFENYGEIGNSKRLVNKLIIERKKRKINTTFELVDIVKSEYRINRKNLFDFLAKIFQAIRIEVNNELGNLKMVLRDSLTSLIKGGRIVVVSYHSLEDRIVKNFLKENSFKKSVSKYSNEKPDSKTELKVLTKKAVMPSREEIKINSRSRSAKLRAAEKI